MGTMSFQRYLEIINSGIVNPICKIEFLRQDESVFNSIVRLPLSGTLTVNNTTGGIRRSVNLVLDNSKKQFTPNPNDFNSLWLNTKFALYLGVKDTKNGDTIFFPQGVFSLGNSDVELISDFSSKTINIRGDDKFSILDNPIGHIHQIPIGTTITSAINHILIDIIKDPKSAIIEETNSTCPYELRWSPTDTYATVLKDLANLYSKEIFYDATGHIVFQSVRDISIMNNIFDFSTKNIQYMGSSRIEKFSEVKNEVIVIGENIDSQTYMAVKQNDDLTSPTRIGFIPKKTKVITDNKIYSQELCQARVNFELKKLIRIQESISLKSIPLFHCDVNQAISVYDDSLNLYKSRYAIQGFQLDITGKTNMPFTGYKFTNTSDYEDLTPSTNNSVS